MQYRKLGKTGLDVSVISFGGIKLGGLEQNLVNRLLDRAIDGGMNYIDTARGYGLSGEKIGHALKGKRDKMIISTKSIKRDFPSFTADFEASFKNLQTDYIDIFFIHDVSTEKNWSGVIENGLIDFLQKQKQGGRIGHIACSTHDCEIGSKMLNTGAFEICMLAYNATNTQIDDGILPLALSKDMGVVIMKPFGGGILTDERSRQLGFEMSAEDSLRFAASKAGVSTVIPGIDKMEYLETALKIGSGEISMADDERAEMIAKVNLQGKQYCRGCGYCLPCPMGIEIPTVLSLLGRWDVFGGIDWANMHQITLEHTEKVPADKTAAACIKCGACQQRCPYNLPIPEMMERGAKSLRRY